ncbi:sensor histidine kinase [Pseudoalteromonas viridis]|uniref:histidine kinase n=1 Tax=Pseudoalteromonas viridis TaxID=339617 RepID=A0ABX7VAJ7_9GAMM|nr:sensor histidine kinase [Pseudoalteromonas viridis]QTL37495.1 CHASE3 domain-containing protein [Pseudoalteromonas viridis]
MHSLTQPNRIQKLIWLIPLLILIGIVLVATLGLKNTDEIARIQRSLQNTGDVMLRVDQLHIDILNAESGQRGYLISQRESDLNPYKIALKKFEHSLQQAQTIQSESPPQQKRLERYIQHAQIKFEALSASVALARDNEQLEPHRMLDDVRSTGLDLRAMYATIMTEEMEIRNLLMARLTQARETAQENLVWFTVLSIAVSTLFLLFLLKHLHSIRRAKEQLERYNEQLEDKVKERTQALELYADELTRSNRELEDFAFIASHDLQEPLRKIRAFSDRIKANYETLLDDRGKDYLSRMDNAATRMSVLITDLLALSRVTTKGKKFEDVALNPLIDTVLDDLEIAISDAQASIQVDPLPTIEGDPSQLHQLFLNLLSNAMKFRREGVPPQITITMSQTTAPNKLLEDIECDWLEVDVTDNGIGFAAEYSEKIFTPFQRLHNRKTYAGTGIGLAVCRRIVERHGGQISAHSIEGQGTTFRILLPDLASTLTLKDTADEQFTDQTH